MKSLKTIICAVILINSIQIYSQDTLSIKSKFYKQQQKSLLLLSSWSAVNLIASPIFSNNLYSAKTSTDYFHQMNFNWNLINAGIVTASHILVHKDNKKPWNLDLISEKKKKAEKSILINMGLDLIYVISGFALNQTANPNKDNFKINKGYGSSLMIQGGYLFLYDAIFLQRLKKIDSKPKFD